MISRYVAGMSRRQFLGELTLAGTAGLLGLGPGLVAAEPPPETTRLRLYEWPAICFAPHYVAKALLQGEGFTDVQYIKLPKWADIKKALASSEIDFAIQSAGQCALQLDAGDLVTVLAGLHGGCYELFATDRVRTIRDLKGKTVSITSKDTGRYVFFVSMLAYVGLDPHTDVTLLELPPTESMQLLADGKIDAFMAFPPEPQELRAKRIGHVVVDTRTDRPWSQYFCCMVSANREFVQKHPVATKRAVRAILKADQICALEPERAARAFLGRGFKTSPEYTLQAVKEVPFGRWREYNPEETVRFYSLRLREAGMIKGNPQQIIAQGTDWRFLNELKKELKG